MELHLKINDVTGMDDSGRHILRVDGEQLLAALMEHEGWLTQTVVREHLAKHPAMMAGIIDDPQVRNTIYMQEKARRETKQERKRQRLHADEQLRRKREEERQARVAEQFQKSAEYRRSVDFYRDILGIDE